MAKYDGLLGQPVLEVEEPDKEGYEGSAHDHRPPPFSCIAKVP